MPAQHVSQPDETSDFTNKIATVAAVGLGVALIEAELIPGMLIGVAAMLAPNLLPKLGNGLRPLIKGAVRAGYSFVDKTRVAMAEASEQMQDIVAEVKAEHGEPGNSGRPSVAAGSGKAVDRA